MAYLMFNLACCRRRGRHRALPAAGLGCVMVLLSLATSCRMDGRAETGEATADAYLRRAGTEWDKLFNLRQVTELAALYSDDAVSMPFNAPTLHGRRELQADF